MAGQWMQLDSEKIASRRMLNRLFPVLLVLASCISTLEAAKPLQVYVLVGQSNMQGHAHVRSLDHMALLDVCQQTLSKIRDKDGTPRVHSDVWISYLSAGGVKTGQLTTGFGADENKIGPELGFGIRMSELQQEPILIIKTAWGGKSLHTDFRPPSAGPYVYRQEQLDRFAADGKDVEKIQKDKRESTGHYYRLMLEHVRGVLADISDVYPDYDAAAGYELSGLVWFQGWNDMVDRGVYPQRDQPGGYDAYSAVFEHFIRDVRKDLKSPELPIVIGVMGAGGPVSEYGPKQVRYSGIHQNFRDAMAAPASKPEFQGRVTAVRTEDSWDLELSRLKSLDDDLRQEVKQRIADGKLEKRQSQTAIDQLRDERMTELEQKTLTTGITNFEFHYYGSAVILTDIGISFADALQPSQQSADN